MRIPGLLVAGLWMASLAGVVADALIESETSWVADLVRDLTRLSIGLGVATLTMWHREKISTRPIDSAYITQVAEFTMRTTWEARGRLEERGGAQVIQLPTQANGIQPPMGWRATSHRTD